MLEITCDDMSIACLDEVLAIEHLSFKTPWTMRAFVHEIQSENSAFKVLKISGRVVGYGGFWRLLDEIHLSNIAVHPDYRRMGLGKMLLVRLLEEAVDIVVRVDVAAFDELGADALGQGSHTTFQLGRGVGEGEPRALGVERLGDTPGDGALVGDADDERRLTLIESHCSASSRRLADASSRPAASLAVAGRRRERRTSGPDVASCDARLGS